MKDGVYKTKEGKYFSVKDGLISTLCEDGKFGYETMNELLENLKDAEYVGELQ